MKQTCILILGMHRSGTSALGGVFEKLGIPMGKSLMKAQEDNPKGFFENERVVDFNDNRLFEAIGLNWCSYLPLDFDWFDKLDGAEELIAEGMEIIKEEYDGIGLFGIKDPRICLLFPFWERVLKELDIEIKIVSPFRSPLEIYRSLNKRDGFCLDQTLLLWAKHVLYAEYYSRDYSRCFVRYSDLLTDPVNTLKKIERHIGIMFPAQIDNSEKNILEFMEKDLKHHDIPVSELGDDYPEYLKKTVMACYEMSGDESTDSDIMSHLDAYRDEYVVNAKLFHGKELLTGKEMQIISNPDFNLLNDELKRLRKLKIRLEEMELDLAERDKAIVELTDNVKLYRDIFVCRVLGWLKKKLK